MRNMIGMQVTDVTGKILGIITDQFREDGREWFVINDEWEHIADGAAEVHDLMGHSRAAHPGLAACWVRLSSKVGI